MYCGRNKISAGLEIIPDHSPIGGNPGDALWKFSGVVTVVWPHVELSNSKMCVTVTPVSNRLKKYSITAPNPIVPLRRFMHLNPVFDRMAIAPAAP
jgi:hypothetical protein